MTGNYYKYKLLIRPEMREIILAFLSELEFDTFEETTEGLNAFLPETLFNPAIENRLEEIKEQFNFEWTRSWIPYQNWNKKWESNFEPILVDDFCGIRANFHPPIPNVKYEILIHPKMAFGTGHHATTYSMIKLMRELKFKKTKVLDFGCGTGILAILANKMGATIIDAVDIELPAYENTLENAQINDTHNIQVYHGTLDNILDSQYDIILANINRNVILESLLTLYNKLKIGGALLTSGILNTDASLIQQAAEKTGFTTDDRLDRGEWVSFKFLR